jgi:hypothetical protein
MRWNSIKNIDTTTTNSDSNKKLETIFLNGKKSTDAT